MQCPRCQFENIPGQDRCLRCNAVLQATVFTGPVNPPRMARWKRPVRNVSRWFRLHVTLPSGPSGPLVKVPAVLKIMSGDAFLGLILSIIPGLAQLIDGRFGKIFLVLAVWLLALAGGVFFYGSSFGLSLLGLAVGLHGWIGYEHVLSKEKVNALDKADILIGTIIILALFYWGIRRTVFSDYVFDYTALTIPSQKIQSRDLLLGRKSLARPANFHRGSIVAASMRNVQGGDNSRSSFRSGRWSNSNPARSSRPNSRSWIWAHCKIKVAKRRRRRQPEWLHGFVPVPARIPGVLS